MLNVPTRNLHSTHQEHNKNRTLFATIATNLATLHQNAVSNNANKETQAPTTNDAPILKINQHVHTQDALPQTTKQPTLPAHNHAVNVAHHQIAIYLQ
jgi:hypothetical protein